MSEETFNTCICTCYYTHSHLFVIVSKHEFNYIHKTNLNSDLKTWIMLQILHLKPQAQMYFLIIYSTSSVGG